MSVSTLSFRIGRPALVAGGLAVLAGLAAAAGPASPASASPSVRDASRIAGSAVAAHRHPIKVGSVLIPPCPAGA